jgi:hypothetical protein
MCTTYASCCSTVPPSKLFSCTAGVASVFATQHAHAWNGWPNATSHTNSNKQKTKKWLDNECDNNDIVVILKDLFEKEVVGQSPGDKKTQPHYDTYIMIQLFLFIIYLTTTTAIISTTLSCGKSIVGTTVDVLQSNQQISVFYSIYYANVTKRFAPSEPIDCQNIKPNHESVGPACFGSVQQVPARQMSENCLSLDIYTRNPKQINLKPVIVFLHGGGNFYGSSTLYPNLVRVLLVGVF